MVNDNEVQAVFERFAAPLLITLRHYGRDETETLVKQLWIALIGGAELERIVWKTMEDLPGMRADNVAAVRQLYDGVMKAAVRPHELKALRQRYKIDLKRPGTSIHAVQEQLLNEVRLPSRPASRKVKVIGAVLACAACGALHGAALGSTLASDEAARVAALIGTVALGLLGAVGGMWYGFLDAAKRLTWTQVATAIMGAVFGGLFGALAGIVVMTIIGTLPGAIIGAALGRTCLPTRPALGTLVGVYVGITVGALIVAMLRHHELATTGALWGTLAGALSSWVLFGALLLVLDLSEQSRRHP